MDDLISRQAAKDAFLNATADGDKVEFCWSVLNRLPSAQKTGKWIEDDDRIIAGHCSLCGWNAIYDETDVLGMPYCPNCGARMENTP